MPAPDLSEQALRIQPCNLTTELRGRPRRPCRGQTRPTMAHGPLERVVRGHCAHMAITPAIARTFPMVFRRNDHGPQLSYERLNHFTKEPLTVPMFMAWVSPINATPAERTTQPHFPLIRPYAAVATALPQNSSKRATGDHSFSLVSTPALSVTSNDRVERPATTAVPRPDAAHDALRSARTRC
jgi:hypothetical protein